METYYCETEIDRLVDGSASLRIEAANDQEATKKFRELYDDVEIIYKEVLDGGRPRMVTIWKASSKMPVMVDTSERELKIKYTLVNEAGKHIAYFTEKEAAREMFEILRLIGTHASATCTKCSSLAALM